MDETTRSEPPLPDQTVPHGSVRAWVADLQSPRSPTAIEALTAIAHVWLKAAAYRVERTAASDQPILGADRPEVAASLGQALFHNRPLPTSVREFYARACTVVRHELIARLDQVLSHPPSESGIQRKRLALWRQFHRNADELPQELQDVHDLWYYARLSDTEIGAILDRPVDAVAQAKASAVHVLQQLFDRDRKKD